MQVRKVACISLAAMLAAFALCPLAMAQQHSAPAPQKSAIPAPIKVCTIPGNGMWWGSSILGRVEVYKNGDGTEKGVYLSQQFALKDFPWNIVGEFVPPTGQTKTTFKGIQRGTPFEVEATADGFKLSITGQYTNSASFVCSRTE